MPSREGGKRRRKKVPREEEFVAIEQRMSGMSTSKCRIERRGGKRSRGQLGEKAARGAVKPGLHLCI